tara:strand:+ start:691 stop:861 length:171 start_codon:yes stop_codon:yes gene_type:complete
MGMRMPAWYDIISLDKTGRADEEGMELSKKIGNGRKKIKRIFDIYYDSDRIFWGRV